MVDTAEMKISNEFITLFDEMLCDRPSIFSYIANNDQWYLLQYLLQVTKDYS